MQRPTESIEDVQAPERLAELLAERLLEESLTVYGRRELEAIRVAQRVAQRGWERQR